MTSTARAGLGRAGEALARRHLEALGYVCIATNWRCRVGELDLVMRDGDCIVFVEVKTRRGEETGRAEEGVTEGQAQRVLASAEWFLAERPDLADLVWRIDVVAITLNRRGVVVRVTHWPNALVLG